MKPSMKRNTSYVMNYMILYAGFILAIVVLPMFLFRTSPYLALLQILIATPFIFLSYQHMNKLLERILEGISATVGHLSDDFHVVLPKAAKTTPEDLDELFQYALLLVKRQVDLKHHYTDAMDELRFHERTREAIFEISNIMMTGSESEVYDKTLEKALSLVTGAKGGSIAILNEMTKKFEFIASFNYDHELLSKINIPLESSAIYQETKGKLTTPVIIDHIAMINEHKLDDQLATMLKKATPFNVASTVSAPLFKDNRFIGFLNVDSDQSGAFTEDDKDLLGFFSSFIGITLKHRDLMEESLYLSRHDKLTGLYNRRYFEELFLQIQEKAFAGGYKFTLVIMDLNYLKATNDTFGHVYGDNALRLFADTVKSHLGPDDIFARYGGDEFIMVFTGSTFDAASDKMSTISNSFNHLSLEYMGKRIPVQFSYGMAFCPDESMVMDILVKIADNRMYQHKKQLKSANDSDPRFRVFSQNQRDFENSGYNVNETLR